MMISFLFIMINYNKQDIIRINFNKDKFLYTNKIILKNFNFLIRYNYQHIKNKNYKVVTVYYFYNYLNINNKFYFFLKYQFYGILKLLIFRYFETFQNKTKNIYA